MSLAGTGPHAGLEALGRSAVANSLGALGAARIEHGELTFTAPAHRILDALTLLKEHPDYRFIQLIDLCGVDYPDRPKRFDVVYHLLSLSKNLRARVKILTDYGFHGYPLRKDFPMTGYVEVRWDEQLKRVIYEPVKLPAEFRSFDFLSPWEGDRNALPGQGTVYILPGDEKAMADAEAKTPTGEA
jgi:NADH-quinone oxidoreductase subunit C